MQACRLGRPIEHKKAAEDSIIAKRQCNTRQRITCCVDESAARHLVGHGQLTGARWSARASQSVEGWLAHCELCRRQARWARRPRLAAVGCRDDPFLRLWTRMAAHGHSSLEQALAGQLAPVDCLAARPASASPRLPATVLCNSGLANNVHPASQTVELIVRGQLLSSDELVGRLSAPVS